MSHPLRAAAALFRLIMADHCPRQVSGLNIFQNHAFIHDNDAVPEVGFGAVRDHEARSRLPNRACATSAGYSVYRGCRLHAAVLADHGLAVRWHGLADLDGRTRDPNSPCAAMIPVPWSDASRSIVMSAGRRGRQLPAKRRLHSKTQNALLAEFGK